MFLLIPFVLLAQPDEEYHDGRITYIDSVFKLNTCGGNSKISYTHEFINPDTILLKVICENYTPKHFYVRPQRDTFFDVSFGYSMFGKTRKPIIYLYPKEETDVDIKLNFNGELSNTYPDYGDGWQVAAKPNGDLINKKDNSKHRYLFWDGINNKNFKVSDFETGFVVKKDETLQFLDSSLTKLGLNDYEKNDFITFWMPLMKQNDYNFVHFIINQECDQIATLDVAPKPDTELRVYILYAKTDANQKVKSQILKTTERTGFTLVEWGGIVLENIKNTK